MKLILTPTTIRMLAVRTGRQERATVRDPLARKRFARRAVAITVALATVIGTLVAAAPEAQPQSTGASTAATRTRPNIVLILTDDQRYDTLWAMPTVQSELVAKGMEFTKGYVSNPLCCPSRTTILTGQYSHSTLVYTNKPGQPYGGFPAFHDQWTIATALHGAGYRTALFGKYLNGYRTSYVPPGWDRWFATWDQGGFYGYSANTDGALGTFGSNPTDYGTDVLAERATGFIRSTDPGRSLFLYFAPHAPHEPATPAPEDERKFSNLEPWRPTSYDEPNVSDKPEYIQAEESLGGAMAAKIDQFRLDQYRSLLAVDRAVSNIIDALADTGRLSNTMIVFMSDNGMLWGEHRWNKKVVPYEESVHVPFVVRADSLLAAPRRDGHLVLNVDVAPTFAQLAGIAAQNMEGRSLLPLIASPTASWRFDFLLEHLKMDEGGVPTYCGVHTSRYVYVDYTTGEEELYDLVRDPNQLTNRAYDAAYRDERRALRERLVQLCRPRPPGFSFSFR
jgi:arylsulfatase A-like enzyme